MISKYSTRSMLLVNEIYNEYIQNKKQVADEVKYITEQIELRSINNKEIKH